MSARRSFELPLKEHWVQLQSSVRASGSDVSGVTTEYVVPGTSTRAIFIMLKFPEEMPVEEQFRRSNEVELGFGLLLDQPLRAVPAHSLTIAELRAVNGLVFQRLT